MAGQIRISPDVMRQRAGQYRNEAENVSSVISSMDNLLNMLQGEWEGEASRSYEQRYQELKPGFQKAQELIEEIAQALDQTATTLEDTDSSIASGFRG
ncbi:MAG: WXG100 family type VII secretion target [Eggerthellaceae bacterium]|nr:WXG100 family type VII secretion target [Eggerthellaceae bacterium]